MDKNSLENIKSIVERLHGCKASCKEKVLVVEKFGNKTAWEGIVYIFHLMNHPQTDKCYAWYSNISETKMRKYYAVLHIPPIDSPEKAVRASIVRDYKVSTK
jgi:hypothetical protein